MGYAACRLGKGSPEAFPACKQIQTTSSNEAFIAGIDNGIKPLNAAALQYVDQVSLHSCCSCLALQ